MQNQLKYNLLHASHIIYLLLKTDTMHLKHVSFDDDNNQVGRHVFSKDLLQSLEDLYRNIC